MKDRPPPKPRVVAPSAKIEKPRRKKQSGKRKNRVALEDREPEPLIGDDPSDDEIERKMSFCCYTCKCTDERKSRVVGEDKVIQTDFDKFYHRRCCHGAFAKNDGTFAGPFEEASVKIEKILMGEMAPDSQQRPTKYTKSQLQGQYDSYKNAEMILHNQDEQVSPDAILDTSPEYLENRKQFQFLASRKGEKEPCVVLDMFAGVGTAIVVLKRLGISMTRVIHCEHDKVATHVYRANHDKYNNESSHDGIEHLYISKFEDIEGDLDSFLQKHGPIDLVIGGPPCVDYSSVNAHRQGASGNQGSYMIRFGQLIQSIQAKQQGRPLFFCAENVPIDNDKNMPLDQGDKSRCQDAFGTKWDPYELDAKYLSPCHRKRYFFSNIPFDCFDYESPLSMVTPACVLEGGYKLAAHHICASTTAKAWTFMASFFRIDDERMLVFRKQEEDGSYRGRYISVLEREVMMGYPRYESL